MLGLSASPTSWNLIDAFKKTAGFLRYGYGDEAWGVLANDEDFQPYINVTSGLPYDLLDKKSGVLLSKKDRGLHIKGYWQNMWDSDPYYPLDTNRIVISTEDSDSNKIFGFLNGAIVANGGIFHPFEVYANGSGEYMSEGEFRNIQRSVKIKFYNKIRSLLSAQYDQDSPGFDAMNIKLDYVTNTRSLSEYIDTGFGNINKIVDGRIIYYKTGDIHIDYDSGSSSWTIDGNPVPDSGIIFATGNVYIRNGFSFKGSILARGSLICYGDSAVSTKIDYDEYTIKRLLYDSIETRLLFMLYRYDAVDDKPVETQRILTKNISISEWKVE